MSLRFLREKQGQRSQGATARHTQSQEDGAEEGSELSLSSNTPRAVLPGPYLPRKALPGRVWEANHRTAGGAKKLCWTGFGGAPGPQPMSAEDG